MSNNKPISPEPSTEQASENKVCPGKDSETSAQTVEPEQRIHESTVETQTSGKPSRPSSITTRFQWRPLGTVRDYFTEQMRQDEFR